MKVLPNSFIDGACDAWRALAASRWKRIVRGCFVALACMQVWPGGAHAAFLEPEEAFQFAARVVNRNAIEVHYNIADGYYLYRERFKFDVKAESGAASTIKLGEPVYPKGEIKFDETFQKDVEHYRKEVAVRIPVEGGAAAPFTLIATSQGCADAGLCYPPQQARARLILVGASAAASPPASGPRVARAPTAALAASDRALDDASRIASTLQGGNLALITLVFAGLGVLLAFTPCVLPMLPILSSIIVGQGDAGGGRGVDKTKGFLLALTYSLGMALVYTALGIAAGLVGEGLAAALQTPLILGAFAFVLVLLALSMFGFYELQVPAMFQRRVSQWSGALGDVRDGKVGAARLGGVFAMGALSALIVGPCIAAPLAGTLVYISQSRDVVVGGVALFALAAGMSVPLLIVGLSAGALLPRAGAWMETVKRFFGALLIAAAIWMIAPVIPSSMQMLAWATLAVIGAVFLRAFDALPDAARGWTRFAKGVGVLLLLTGAVEFIGAVTGGRDVLRPLAHFDTATMDRSTRGASAAVRFESVKSSAELDRRVANAGRPVLLDFYADWCVSCKEMERYTYSDPRIAAKMGGFLLLKADVTANDADDRALLKRFGLFGPPGIVFFDRNGKPIVNATVIGYQNAERFLASLAHADS